MSRGLRGVCVGHYQGIEGCVNLLEKIPKALFFARKEVHRGRFYHRRGVYQVYISQRTLEQKKKKE